MKETIRSWLNYWGDRAPWLARLFLLVVSPSPRLYLFVARSARLGEVAAKRVWRISSGPLAGFRLTNLLPDEILPVLANTMEIHCSNLLKRLPLESQTVLDIGASYGYYALLLGRFVGEGGKVFSFDPDWHSFERLTHNLAMNNIKNVIPVPICASNSSNGLAHWNFFEDKPWNSRLADDGIESGSQRLTVVPVMTLDDFACAINIREKTRLIKIDVEGAELKVLEGATKLLEESKPVLLCELHGSEIAKKVFAFLSEVNYQWEMIEYMGEARQHVLAFPCDQAERYRSLIFHSAG